MVYVLNKDNQPLMPTIRHGKVRRLLKSGRAKVVKRCPFTIKLHYEIGSEIQEVVLGIDAGSKTIGVSASTETKELYSAEVLLRNDIVDLLSTRREFRRARRSRKTRYRKAKFLNRVKSKNKGWLAPSVENKIGTHFMTVKNVMKILPISKVIVETASFDIQKIKNLNISGVEYQQGEQLGFWNVREYVLWRDNHKCQCCKGKSKDKILNVHHIESRKTGGDAPNNLVTLCEYCHTQYHKENLELPKSIKRGTSYKDAAFMGIMRWAFYNRLKDELDISVCMTYGYITKNTRIANGLPKEHRIDALCISGHPMADRLDHYYLQKKVRCHNRQLHKATINKGGYRKNNQAPKYVFDFQLFDKVRFGNEECFVFGRRASGSFDVRRLDGERVSAGVSYKKLYRIEKRKSVLTERRIA